MGITNDDNAPLPAAELSDETLVRMIQGGDEIAFKLMFDRYQKKLRAYALKLLKSREVADEILQEAFLKVWLKRKDLDSDLNFNYYLFKIAKNLVLKQFEKIGREERLKQEVLKNSKRSSYTTEETVRFAEYQRIAHQVVQSLPPQQQSVYLLSRRDGKDNKEIAAALGISVKTVQNHLRLALITIKEKLRVLGDITGPLIAFFLFS
ncbi:RNA polymerase sigma-70 factor [Fulvivirgaceae bacterium BMA12]|uniref:RNA polymerase sigma-70 factor n=1 Tax=Agaribacillus aureus TaxID=3051825 RepID=A0ABT8LK08_9BACT|nr:RNA polymerase sigma-70 factor [Fulvivirgaceae bacterium BMA12]